MILLPAERAAGLPPSWTLGLCQLGPNLDSRLLYNSAGRTAVLIESEWSAVRAGPLNQEEEVGERGLGARLGARRAGLPAGWLASERECR